MIITEMKEFMLIYFKGEGKVVILKGYDAAHTMWERGQLLPQTVLVMPGRARLIGVGCAESITGDNGVGLRSECVLPTLAPWGRVGSR